MESNMARKIDGRCTASLVLGIVGLVAWLIPILGLAVQITGLVLGILGHKRTPCVRAKVGIILCSLGAVGSLINWIIGAMLVMQRMGI